MLVLLVVVVIGGGCVRRDCGAGRRPVVVVVVFLLVVVVVVVVGGCGVRVCCGCCTLGVAVVVTNIVRYSATLQKRTQLFTDPTGFGFALRGLTQIARGAKQRVDRWMIVKNDDVEGSLQLLRPVYVSDKADPYSLQPWYCLP